MFGLVQVIAKLAKIILKIAKILVKLGILDGDTFSELQARF